MTDSEQRAMIRGRCAGVRKLLASVRPVAMHATLQEVGWIEGAALTAGCDDFQAVGERLDRLMGELKDQGIITAQTWEQFFIERD